MQDDFNPFRPVDASYGSARTMRYMHHEARRDLRRAVDDVATRAERAADDMRRAARNVNGRGVASRVTREMHHVTSSLEYVATYELRTQQYAALRRQVLEARWAMGSEARKAERKELAAQAARRRAEMQAKARMRLQHNRAKLGRAQARVDEPELNYRQRDARQKVLAKLQDEIKRDAATVGEQPDGTPLEVAAA